MKRQRAGNKLENQQQHSQSQPQSKQQHSKQSLKQQPSSAVLSQEPSSAVLSQQAPKFLTSDATLPIFDCNSITSSQALEYYKRYQILHYRVSPDEAAESSNTSNISPLAGLRSIYRDKPAQVAKQWTIENDGDRDDAASVLNPEAVLGDVTYTGNKNAATAVVAGSTGGTAVGNVTKISTTSITTTTLPLQFYVSTILQDDADANSRFLQSAGVATPPFVDSSWGQFNHGRAIWVFAGSNRSGDNLLGRYVHLLVPSSIPCFGLCEPVI
jgi:hypothetical protein